MRVKRLTTRLKPFLIVLGIFVASAVAIHSAERLSVLYFGPRAQQSYEAVAGLRSGMDRQAVSAQLKDMPGRFFPSRDNPKMMHFIVPYSLFESCSFALEFQNERFWRLFAGDSNQPGPCPGGPRSWTASEDPSS